MSRGKFSSVFSRDFLDACAYKLFFYSYYSAFGSTISYFPLFFKQIGLNAVQVGVLMSVPPFLQTFGTPLAALLADKYKIRKTIALFALLAFFGKHLGILLLEHPRETCMRTLLNSTEYSAFNQTFEEDNQRVKNVSKKETLSDFVINRRGHHRNEQTFLPLKKQEFSNEDEITLNQKNHTDSQALEEKSPYKQSFNNFRLPRQLQTLDVSEKKSHLNQTLSNQNYTSEIIRDNLEKNRYFVYALVIIIITEFLGSSLSALIDAAIVEFLGENRNDFGKYRLWGSIGIGSSAFLTGAVIQSSVYYYCQDLHKKYYLMFYIVFGFVFFSFIPLLYSKHVYYEETRENSKSARSKLKIIFCSIKNATFWMTALSLAILDGFQMDFGPWFMDDLGTSPVIIGLATASHFAINTVTYVMSPYIINRFGHMSVLSLGLFVDIVVFILFSMAQRSWLAVVLFSLSGFVPSLTWSCGISYVAMVSSPLGIVTTAEGLFHAMYNGIGISFGTVTGGIVIGTLGIRTAFQVLAGLSAFNLITMNVALYIDKKLSQDSSYEPLKTAENEQ